VSVVVSVRLDRPHKPGQIDPERTGEAIDVHQRYVAAPAFQAAVVGDVELSGLGEGLLGHAAGETERPHRATEGAQERVSILIL